MTRLLTKDEKPLKCFLTRGSSLCLSLLFAGLWICWGHHPVVLGQFPILPPTDEAPNRSSNPPLDDSSQEKLPLPSATTSVEKSLLRDPLVHVKRGDRSPPARVTTSWLENVPAGAHSQFLGDFEIIWFKGQWAIRHPSDPFFLSPYPTVPTLRLITLHEPVQNHKVTKRLLRRIGDVIPFTSPWQRSHSPPGMLLLSREYSGACPGRLWVRFSLRTSSETQADSLLITAWAGGPSSDLVSSWFPSVFRGCLGDRGERYKGPRYLGIELTWRHDPSERLLGLGTQYTYLNLVGHDFTTLSQEQGHGRGLQPLTWVINHFGRGSGGDETTSYHYVPHLIFQRGKSLWLNSIQHAYFHGSQLGRFSIATRVPYMSVVLNKASSPKELVSLFAKRFGVTRPLPDWVHRGAMVALGGGEQGVRDQLAELLDLGAAVSSVWIQDWMGVIQTYLGQRLRWNWHFDRGRYPNWRGMVSDFKERGISTLSYFNPRFSTKRCERPCQLDIARKHGFLVKDVHSRPIMIGNGGFDFAMLDLSLQSARDWYARLMTRHVEQGGVKGWMADFSESLPFYAVMQDGSRGSEYHNQYIMEWSKFNGEMIDSIDDGFVFVRSGTLGSHRYVHAFWLGDQITSWDEYDGLASTITALITSGLSGALVNHSDIGGLTSLRIPGVAYYRRTKELFERWMQVNAFTPIFRTHEGLWPRDAHQHDSDRETLEQYVRYSQIYASLFAYRQRLVLDTQQRGWPMVRGMFFEYPHESWAWDLKDQFMLGSDIIVAPVLEPGAQWRRVYLPSGAWRDIFTREIYARDFAGPITVPVSRHEIPVFVREGSVVAEELGEAFEHYGLR